MGVATLPDAFFSPLSHPLRLYEQGAPIRGCPERERRSERLDRPPADATRLHHCFEACLASHAPPWSPTDGLHTPAGLKVEALASLLPATSAKTLLLTAHYKQPSLHTRAVLDVFKGPTFTADAVLGRDGFLFGAESCYSVPTGSITRYALAAGYAAPTYSVTAHALANLSVASVSYYHKVSKDAEVGAKMVYDIKSRGTPGLEFGSKVYLDVGVRLSSV